MLEKSRRRIGIAKEKKGPSPASICRFCWFIRIGELEAGIVEWGEQIHAQLIEAGLSQGITIDGKSIRRATSLGAKNVHLLRAVCHQVRLMLAQVAVDDKINEITAIQPLFEKLLLKGLVITVDALLTQRKVARKLRRGGHYLL